MDMTIFVIFSLIIVMLGGAIMLNVAGVRPTPSPVPNGSSQEPVTMASSETLPALFFGIPKKASVIVMPRVFYTPRVLNEKVEYRTRSGKYLVGKVEEVNGPMVTIRRGNHRFTRMTSELRPRAAA